MTSYKVIYHKNAEKFIKKNKVEGLKFYKAFIEMSQDKKNFLKYDVKKLINKENKLRLRIGKNRAIFEVFEDKIVIFVFDIDSRGGIYK